MLADEFQYGLIGSSEPYDALVIPWGSSPITDYLLSGDRLSIVHDGAGFSRTDKVAEVRHNQVACQTLLKYAGLEPTKAATADTVKNAFAHD